MEEKCSSRLDGFLGNKCHVQRCGDVSLIEFKLAFSLYMGGYLLLAECDDAR